MPTSLIIDAHPNPESLTAGIARTYATHATDARLISLRDLQFDLHMRHGYRQRMPIEPDLADARAAIRAAEHLVIATPVWWRSTPALLKGFLDRALLPHEEYQYSKRGLPEGLLGGRTARVFATSDTPRALQPLMPDTRLRSLTHGTLRFCGIAPVRVTRFAPVKSSSPQQRTEWLRTVERLARAERPATR